MSAGSKGKLEKVGDSGHGKGELVVGPVFPLVFFSDCSRVAKY